jgi:hypothetical protein
MDANDLTSEELAFLKRHGLSAADVYNGPKQTVAQRPEAAKAAGCSEMLDTSFGVALKAVADALGDSKRSDVWMSPRWADYDRIAA